MKPRKIDTLAVLGVGLLGGSLAAALRARGLVGRVLGAGRRESSLKVAVDRGLIDEPTLDPAAAAGEADLVVLATPVGQFSDLLARIGAALRPDAVVTDVGSTKAQVVADAERLLPHPGRFVGSHPIAGSEKRGPAFAAPDLFEGALCLLTPTERTEADAVQLVRWLWMSLGMRVRQVGPAEHDAILARTSHLPHLAAAALVDVLTDSQATFIGPGFLDTTRIAAGDPGMWTDICRHNGPAIAAALDALIDRLTRMREGLQRGDADAVAELLARAQTRRRALDAERRPDA
jgi:prephenate dehydrogenase